MDSYALLALIDRFKSGDTVLSTANEIEGLVLECFTEEEWFDDVSLALALYRPGEGSPYYDVSELTRELDVADAALRARLAESDRSQGSP